MTNSNEKKLNEEKLEYWINKYCEEPISTRNRVLPHAQKNLSKLEFGEYLVRLINWTQSELTNKLIEPYHEDLTKHFKKNR